MPLVCNICEKKATYRVVIIINPEGIHHGFYYCIKHKPKSFELQKMDKKQHDDGEIIKQDRLKQKLRGEK